MSKRRSVQRGRLGLCQVTSLSPAVSGKEAKREVGSKVFGPFKIINRIGSVAFRLELPSDATIHPVFNVSQLRRALGKTDTCL